MQFNNIDGNFKEIPGYEDYFISKNGVVVSTKYGDTKELRSFVDADGYHRITVYNDSKPTTFRRSRLVAIVWVKNDDPKRNKIVLHNDGSKDHDIASNLRWGTHKENMEDKKLHGTNYGGDGKRKFIPTTVGLIRTLHSTGSSIYQLAATFEADRATIRRLVRGVTYQDVL